MKTNGKSEFSGLVGGLMDGKTDDGWMTGGPGAQEEKTDQVSNTFAENMSGLSQAAQKAAAGQAAAEQAAAEQDSSSAVLYVGLGLAALVALWAVTKKS